MLKPNLNHNQDLLKQLTEALEWALTGFNEAYFGRPIPDDAISAVEAALARLEKALALASKPQTPAPPPEPRQP